jgi:predicted kinase
VSHRPTLIVVSGPPGAGKTTLAHALARAVPCPAICRDEIKEGMAHATPSYVPAPGDALARGTYTTFFAILELLVDAGVSVVAEAAFQDRLWRQGLTPLLDRATVRLVQCTVDPAIARDRHARRLERDPRSRAAHDDLRLSSSPEPFVALTLPVRTLRVETTDGYAPSLPEIVAFVGAAP